MTKEEILKSILEKPKKLSQAQVKAVTSEKKYLKIVAGAGAGKTETMTRRIVYLLLYKNVAPKEIIAFTFTERAAQSIKDRIYKRVRNLYGDIACARLGEMYVGTIHAYCFRVLQDYFGYGDHEVLDENQEMAFIMREGWSLELGDDNYSRNCQAFIQSVNVVYDELLSRSDIEKKDNRFAQHLEDYEQKLKKHRLLTFGQMAALAVEKLEKNSQALEHVKYLIVDEYQDINRAQERLIQLIGKNASVFVVGDPRQTIYQWRGSDQKCFERFKAEESISIPENRRSGKKIVELANNFAKTFEGAKYEAMSGIRGEEGMVSLVKCETNISEAEWITRQIKNLVGGKKLCSYSDIAILFRSVSTSAKPFIDNFKKEDIPYLVGGKVGLFRRDEAQAVGRIFAWLGDKFWVENHYNWSDRTEGDALLDSAIDYWKSTLKVKSTTKNLRKNLETLKNNVQSEKYKDFTEIYQDLLTILGFLNFNPEDKLHAAIMANLGRFNKLLTDYESSIRRGGNKPDWRYDLNGLCWYMNTYATGAYEEQPAEDLRGTDAIQIMTIHQSKGLEWPVVFVPCMVANRFPSSRAGSEKKWYVPEELFDVKRYQGGVEDEKRLFYVAITRAMDILTISRFERINNSRSPSEFWETLQKLLKEQSEQINLSPVKIEKPPDSEEIQSYSARQIITYLRCPYQYRLREIWGYQPKLSPDLGYGKSLHHCLRYASEKIKNGMKLEKAIHEAVAEKFHMPYADSGRKQKLQQIAEKRLFEFVKKNEEDMYNIEEVESRLEFPMEYATITGRVDVILKTKPSPCLEVRDYKTSDTVTTPDQSALQLRLYTLGLRLIGRPADRASIAYLEDGKVKQVDVSTAKLEDGKKIAEECIKEIRRGNFKGKVTNKCFEKEGCDYSKICRYAKFKRYS
ncbi:MAG: ATP-dependent DNA helicase [bacterium]